MDHSKEKNNFLISARKIMICNIKLQKYHLYLLHLCFIIKWWAVPGAPGQQSKSNLYIFKALCNGRSRKTAENYILLFSFNDAIRPFQFFLLCQAPWFYTSKIRKTHKIKNSQICLFLQRLELSVNLCFCY